MSSLHGVHRLALVLLALAAGLVSGCGDDDDERAGGEERQGGAITISQLSQPDFLDPALGYTANAWEPLWLVYTPPVTYRRAEGVEGTELIPGLAEELPEVSSDGRTVSFTFREGLRFSDGTPLRASDFEHTIKRVLSLESGAIPFYLGIEGAKRYLEDRKPEADISGIETNDATGEVKIRLVGRQGTFLNALAMNFAGVVPGETPFRNMTEEPPPGIGPYRITESVPNRQFVMERNRAFDIPGIPGGHLDRITTRIIPSRERQTSMVIRGELDYMTDPPSRGLLPQVRARYGDRYEEHATVSTHYYFMNVRQPPFDRKAVRQAVNYAIDSRAVARLFSGRLQPSCNFLPPSIPGYEKPDPCPYGDPAGPGNVEKAIQLVEQSGAEGAKVTVWTNTDDLALALGTYLEDLLDRIGLDAKLEALNGAVFFQTVGSQETGAQIGIANWFQDFPHPANFLFLVDGDSIQPTNNQNFGNVDDPELNRLIDRVEQLPADQAAEAAAEADRLLVEEAYVAPLGSEELSTFLSERMDFENCSRFHPVNLNDYSSFCLK